ncbi:MAG: twin-arginine translocase subunit TatC [Syntrophorhabdaceae bacterium]|nr:twin-arginine translocase subunit TatC [Syntrophorhabdaceae bacterium]
MEREKIIGALTGVRKVFLKSLAFIAVAGVVSFIYSKEMLLLLVKATGIKVYYLTIQEVFLATVQLALFAGIFFALPVIIFFAWYEMKGLYKIKPVYGYLLVFAAIILFYGGSLFCFKVVLPSGITFLVTGYESQVLKAMISVERYLTFSAAMIFAFGITFEVPLILLALGKLGIVKARMLVRTRRYAILGIVVASALITPTPDVYNLTLLAGPMYIFYEIGILLVKMVERQKAMDP